MKDLAFPLSASLKELGGEMQKIIPYKTMKCTEPPIRRKLENQTSTEYIVSGDTWHNPCISQV